MRRWCDRTRQRTRQTGRGGHRSEWKSAGEGMWSAEGNHRVASVSAVLAGRTKDVGRRACARLAESARRHTIAAAVRSPLPKLTEAQQRRRSAERILDLTSSRAPPLDA